jgi:hypothetical protein
MLRSNDSSHRGFPCSPGGPEFDSMLKHQIELNTKNDLNFVIPSLAVSPIPRPVLHWSAVLISRNHSITRLISFPKNDPIQRSLLYWLRAITEHVLYEFYTTVYIWPDSEPTKSLGHLETNT